MQPVCRFFFFNHTATTEIYTLSLHDALPIYSFYLLPARPIVVEWGREASTSSGSKRRQRPALMYGIRDRKSTRLNSSHANLVCRLLLEKKKQDKNTHSTDKNGMVRVDLKRSK